MTYALLTLAVAMLALALRTGSMRALVCAVVLFAGSLIDDVPAVMTPFSVIADALNPEPDHAREK